MPKGPGVDAPSAHGRRVCVQADVALSTSNSSLFHSRHPLASAEMSVSRVASKQTPRSSQPPLNLVRFHAVPGTVSYRAQSTTHSPPAVTSHADPWTRCLALATREAPTLKNLEPWAALVPLPIDSFVPSYPT